MLPYFIANYWDIYYKSIHTLNRKQIKKMNKMTQLGLKIIFIFLIPLYLDRIGSVFPFCETL